MHWSLSLRHPSPGANWTVQLLIERQKRNSHISVAPGEEAGTAEREVLLRECHATCWVHAHNLPAPVWAVWRWSCRTRLCRPPRRSCWRSSGRCPRLSAECRRPGGSSPGHLRGDDTHMLSFFKAFWTCLLAACRYDTWSGVSALILDPSSFCRRFQALCLCIAA